MQQQKVFVSGASGYLAGHIIELLLKRGYNVVGSVRSLQNEQKFEHLKKILPQKQKNLTLVEADITNKEKWNEILNGCDFLIHTASISLLLQKKDPEILIKESLDGVENVISAAIKNKLKKIVITSACSAIEAGRFDKNLFTDDDWSDMKNCTPYEKSKHLVEKKAWELVNNNKKNGGITEMTSINPSFIQGPAHSATNSFVSSDFISKIMTKQMPGLAHVCVGYVDVREVAIAHVNAIEREISNGKRYQLSQGSYWLDDISGILRQEFEPLGYQLTTRVLPKPLLYLASYVDKTAAILYNKLDRYIINDNSASQKDLGIQYRNIKETLLDTVYDLIEKGKLPNKLPENHQKNYKISKFDYEI